MEIKNKEKYASTEYYSAKAVDDKGEEYEIHNPSGLPDPGIIEEIQEPFIDAQIITKTDYYGQVMRLCLDKRGELKKETYLSSDRAELSYDIPLAEIVFDFYDKLKSISKGYASFDYQISEFRKASLVKLDILVNSEKVDALSSLIHADNAYKLGRKMAHWSVPIKE